MCVYWLHLFNSWLVYARLPFSSFQFPFCMKENLGLCNHFLDALFNSEMMDEQADGTYTYSIESLARKVCAMARESGEDKRCLRASSLQCLSAMVLFPFLMISWSSKFYFRLALRAIGTLLHSRVYSSFLCTYLICFSCFRCGSWLSFLTFLLILMRWVFLNFVTCTKCYNLYWVYWELVLVFVNVKLKGVILIFVVTGNGSNLWALI